MKKAIIKKTKGRYSGQYRFNLVAANGEIVATSETYKAKQKALQTLAECFADFPIEDKTGEGA